MSNSKLNTDLGTNEFDILSHNLWEIVGMELSEDQQKIFEDSMNESILMDFIDNDFQTAVGEERTKEIMTMLKEQDMSFGEFTEQIEEEIEKLGKSLTDMISTTAKKIYESFVQFQISELESGVAAITNEEEKASKTKILENIKELQKNSKWSEMGILFKQIGDLKAPRSLVLHL